MAVGNLNHSAVNLENGWGMDFKKHLETAWNLTIRCIVPLILSTLVMYVVGIITLGVLAPVILAGYMQSILLLLREGREPKIQDLFSHMSLFFPLLGFGIIAFVVTVIGFIFLILPGLIITLAISFFCLYMLPLMTDEGLGLIAAIKKSGAMSVQEKIVEHIIVVIIFLGITWVGQSVIFGFLFTQPLATLFLLSVYEEKKEATQTFVFHQGDHL